MNTSSKLRDILKSHCSPPDLDLIGFLHSYKCACVNQHLSQQPLSGERYLLSISLIPLPWDVIVRSWELQYRSASLVMLSAWIHFCASHTVILPVASILLSAPAPPQPPQPHASGCLRGPILGTALPLRGGIDWFAMLFTLNKETFI